MPQGGAPDQPMLAIEGPPLPAPQPPTEQLVRNLTADLQLPPEVDELLKEHSDFLYASGAATTTYFLLAPRALRRGKQAPM
jgi:hypothetical protein